jgi:hypothetical protein
MDYDEFLKKLFRMRELMEKSWRTPTITPQERQEIALLYGECEELITRILGVGKVKLNDVIYPNLIEAGWLTGYTHYESEGHSQLIKVIGRVQQLASGKRAPVDAPQYSDAITTLRRFRECCQYQKEPPSDERAVQNILWIMLRARFARVDKEDSLPTFGVKNYKPDFGLPDLGLLVEAKFIGTETSIGKIQDELLADATGYLSNAAGYSSIVIFVYDAAHKLRDDRPFVEALKSVDGISDVIVVPGFSSESRD